MCTAVIGSSGFPPGLAGTSLGGAEYPNVLLDRTGQAVEDVAHPDGVIDPIADPDVIHPDGDELPGVDAARVGGRVDLVEADAAGVDDEVGTLDRLEDGGGRGGPRIDPDELGMGLGQDPLVHRHRGERAAQRLDQRPEPVLELEPRDRVGGEDGQRPGGLDPLGDRRDGPGQVGAAGGLRVRGRRRTVDRRDGIIGGDEDVGGPALRPRRGDQPLHLVGAVVGGDHRRDARRLRRDVGEVLELAVAERVVDDLADPLLAHRRHADDVEDARPLGPGPHHAVERGQLADGVRGHQHRTAPHAGVAVGRVRRVQLVGTSDPADRLAPRDRVAELEREVPRDAEAVGDPLAGEPSDDVIRDVWTSFDDGMADSFTRWLRTKNVHGRASVKGPRESPISALGGSSTWALRVRWRGASGARRDEFVIGQKSGFISDVLLRMRRTSSITAG